MSHVGLQFCALGMKKKTLATLIILLSSLFSSPFFLTVCTQQRAESLSTEEKSNRHPKSLSTEEKSNHHPKSNRHPESLSTEDKSNHHPESLSTEEKSNHHPKSNTQNQFESLSPKIKRSETKSNRRPLRAMKGGRRGREKGGGSTAGGGDEGGAKIHLHRGDESNKNPFAQSKNLFASKGSHVREHRVGGGRRGRWGRVEGVWGEERRGGKGTDGRGRACVEKREWGVRLGRRIGKKKIINK